MNRNANMIFGVVAAAALTLFGCINNVDTESGGNSDVPDGKCSLTVDSGLSARAAFPSSLAGDMVYAAEISYSSSGATKWLGADSVENSPAVLKNSPSASGEIRFVFCAPEESAEYTITVFACPAGTSVASAADVENAAAASGHAEFSLEAGQKALETPVKVSLSPTSNVSGTGSVDLPLSFDSSLGIVAAKVNVTKDGVSDSSGNNYGFEISVSGNSARLSAENAPAGTYLVIMKFYKSTTDFSSSNEVAVNSAVQQVSVYSGMKTDCWFVDGKRHGTTAADGTFTPSALELTKYDFTELYVLGSDAASGETDGKLVFYNEEHFGNSIPTITNVNDGDGSMTNPFATVQKAVDKIAAAGDTSKKYTIYVDGTVTADASSDFKEDGRDKTFIYINPSNKLYLTIKGFSQDSKAVLNANQKDSYGGNVLSSSENVSLILENLKITGGKRGCEGGGICSKGSLTLNACVVTNNISGDCGGGILFEGTQLIVENSEISENKSEAIYDIGGGGICAFGNIAIKNSTVFNNSVTDDSSIGGGLYFGYYDEPATVNIQDSQIHGNSAKDGGAIGIESGIVTLSNCEIYGNSATGNGGAIFIKTINQITEAKLTIKENVSIDSNRTDGNGGAIYATTNQHKDYAQGKNSYVTIGENENSGGIVITGNYANRGGAFYGADNARFVMNAGEVSENHSTGITSGDGGGAMFIWGGSTTNYSTFIMNGGEISGNRAKFGAGGAVHIDDGSGKNASFIMTGGVLADNYACNGYNDPTGSNLGGAIYLKNGGQIKLSGSAVIAVSEESDNCNDIYLGNNQTITITGTLAPGNNAAAGNPKYTARITPENYTVETALITADSGVTLKDEVEKFCITGNDESDEWFITSAGYLSKPTAISSLSSVPDFSKYPKLTVSTGDEMGKLAGWVEAGNNMEGVAFTLMNDVTIDSMVGGLGKNFNGSFDGNGKTITSNGELDSIFGFVNGGEIKNVISEGKFLKAGIASYLKNGIIENCKNNAMISVTGYGGGIVGQLQGGSKIKNCINNGNVAGVGDIGGFAGETFEGSSILNCINLGKIESTGSGDTGGIAGNNQSGVVIDNCVNVGQITGTGDLGAIAGYGDEYIKKAYYLKSSANRAVGNRVTVNTTFSFDSPSEELITKLNAWVTANSTETEKYLEWKIVDGNPSLVYE